VTIKSKAIRRKSVDVRGLDVLISITSERIEILIISEKKDQVRFFISTRGMGRDGKSDSDDSE